MYKRLSIDSWSVCSRFRLYCNLWRKKSFFFYFCLFCRCRWWMDDWIFYRKSLNTCVITRTLGQFDVICVSVSETHSSYSLFDSVEKVTKYILACFAVLLYVSVCVGIFFLHSAYRPHSVKRANNTIVFSKHSKKSIWMQTSASVLN